MKKWKRGLKRITAIALAVLMVVTTVDLSTFAVSAAGEGSGTYCEHHTEHTPECGYTEGIEGSPCTHEHGEECYSEVTVCVHGHDESCGYVEGVEDSCTHICSLENGCIISALNCTHEHDEACGYQAAVEGTPCIFECEECANASNDGSDTVSGNEVSDETTVCTCETDDPAFHATNCPAYSAPENPQCFCAEKCTDDTLNVWCDVCGVQGVSACQGEDIAVTYAATTHDINTGSLEISSDGDYTITGDGNTTSNTITIKSNVTANVILSNVSISSSNTPIDIETGATLNLTLLGENTLTSNTVEDAALHVPTGAKLVITDESTGSLNATGGYRAAGIGGGKDENSGDVEIHGGTITAKMQHYNDYKNGAGIGGGYAGSNGSVTITGGYVNASSTNGGAGIGAGFGWGYNGGTVTITGGTVIVSGKGQYINHGAGIGGGHNNGNGGTVVITGGNVQAIAGDGAEAIGKGNGSGSSGTLKDSAGNDISLIEIALDGVSDKTSVTNIVVDGSTYGSKDVVTIGDKLYLYLPAGSKVTSVTAGGNTYVCCRNGKMYENHSGLVEATCYVAEHCIACDKTLGETLPHNYVDGVCTVCGMDENGVFHITKAEHLVAFAQYVNAGNKDANAELDANINMTGVAWTPICQTVSYHSSEATDTGYSGTFNGNGHTILNLTVTGISGDTYS